MVETGTTVNNEAISVEVATVAIRENRVFLLIVFFPILNSNSDFLPT